MDVGVGDRIRSFIQENILFDDGPMELTDEAPLLNGVVDSLGLMQLVAFLESEYDISIDDADITAENFRTVASITELVSHKANQGAPRG